MDACRHHVALDEPTISARIAQIAACERLRPEIFVIHHDCVAAATASDLDAIATAFAALGAAAVAATQPFGPRCWHDASFSAAEAARYQWAFGDEGDTRIVFTAPPPAIYAQAARSLEAAMAALRDADPELHGEMLGLVGEVVFAAGAPGAAMTFDGVTAFYATGALVLNAAEHQTVPGALATLAHETAHALMFAASEGRPLVENAPDERYPSPLRDDPRPMNGVFHATIVTARMAYALDRVLAADCLAGAGQAEAAALRAGARQAFQAGLDVVGGHGRPTALGAGFLRGAERYMATRPA